MAEGQRPQAPKATAPVVSCSDAQKVKACSSFKQLVDAHDKDILDAISSPPLYVCFRPNEDTFFMLHFEEPRNYGWKADSEGGEGGEKQQFPSSVSFATYRDGIMDDFEGNYGYWWRSDSNDDTGLFHTESTAVFKGFKVTIAGSEISVQDPFMNQNGGITRYSLTIRRSTGRFSETFDVDGKTSSTDSGTCLIYPASIK